MEMRESCFSPSVLHVDEGASVTFVNRDAYPHAVVGTDWGSFEMLEGDELVQEFPRSGTFVYACHLHPGMTGAVVVGEAAAALAAPIAEGSSSSAAPAAGVGLAALVIGLGAGGFVGRRTRGSGVATGQ